MTFLILAAAGSLCLAVAMWIALVAARGLRQRSAVHRRQSRAAVGLAITRYCGDGDTDGLSRSLARFPVEDVIAVAGRALAALSQAERIGIGRALAGCGIPARIRRDFKRADENRRILHCELMGSIGGTDAAAILRRGLADRAPGVRIAAAIALVQTDRAPPLADLLARLGPQARASARLVFLLEQLLPERAADVVQLVTDIDGEPRLRISALHALDLGAPSAHRSVLLRLGQEREASVAATAARALGREPGAQAGSALIAMLSHAAPEVRGEAAAALGAAGFAPARAALIGLTGDPDRTVAAAAARSLWLLRGRSARPEALSAPALAEGGW